MLLGSKQIRKQRSTAGLAFCLRVIFAFFAPLAVFRYVDVVLVMISNSSADNDTHHSVSPNEARMFFKTTESDPYSYLRLQMKDKCEFIPGSKGPIPVILMSLGRSGSTSTWQILGNLTGLETVPDEYPGSNPKQTMAFFTEKVKQNDKGEWAFTYLCKKQQQFPNAGIVGFKWKPHYNSIHTNAAKAALALIAASKSHDQPIRVIRLRRNLLDVMISANKHKKLNKLPHCTTGDEHCVQKHLKAGTGLVMEAKSLVEKLRTWTKEEDAVDELLVDMNVHHIQVSYEKLYNAEDPGEWMRIFRFLQRGPAEELRWDQVRGAMKTVVTSNTWKNVSLRNYDEIQRTLGGTEFEYVLH